MCFFFRIFKKFGKLFQYGNVNEDPFPVILEDYYYYNYDLI